MGRRARSVTTPGSPGEEYPPPSGLRRRAASTVRMMSDIAGMCANSVSILARGTAITRVSRQAR